MPETLLSFVCVCMYVGAFVCTTEAFFPVETYRHTTIQDLLEDLPTPITVYGIIDGYGTVCLGVVSMETCQR